MRRQKLTGVIRLAGGEILGRCNEFASAENFLRAAILLTDTEIAVERKRVKQVYIKVCPPLPEEGADDLALLFYDYPSPARGRIKVWWYER